MTHHRKAHQPPPLPLAGEGWGGGARRAGRCLLAAITTLAALVPHTARAQDEEALADVRDYIVGPDMGTDEVCMGWVKAEIGRAVGLPRELGGIPLDELGATGFGLRVACEEAVGFCDFPLAGARRFRYLAGVAG